MGQSSECRTGRTPGKSKSRRQKKKLHPSETTLQPIQPGTSTRDRTHRIAYICVLHGKTSTPITDRNCASHDRGTTPGIPLAVFTSYWLGGTKGLGSSIADGGRSSTEAVPVFILALRLDLRGEMEHGTDNTILTCSRISSFLRS